jgi:hypothetical protein
MNTFPFPVPHSVALQAGALSRPGPGTTMIANALGTSTGAPPNGATFDSCFRPSLSGLSLLLGHGYVSSTGGDGPHAPLINGIAIGGTALAPLTLDPSEVNADTQTSFAVLQVTPDAKGQITAASALQGLEIVHSKDASPGTLATLGSKALTLILWSNGSPLKAFQLVHFNLTYLRVIPAPGAGAPAHFFF